MKRKYFSILLAAMTIAASANVYAAPSIGQIIPEAPKVELREICQTTSS